MFLITMLSLNSCSTKSPFPSNHCEELPIFVKEDFRLVKNNTQCVKKLIQTNAIKNCSCLEPPEQETCYQKFIPEKFTK